MKGTKLSALGLMGSVLALTPAYAQGDITGAWEVTVESPQGAATIDVTFKQVGEAVTGTVTTPMGAVDFKGTLIDDALNVSSALEVQGNKLDMALTATVSGDMMTGKLVIAGMGEVPWTAKRKRAATAPRPAAPAIAGAGDLSGTWDIVMSLGGIGALSMTGTFAQAGEQITGTLRSPAGDMPVTGTIVGQALTLEFKAPTPRGDLPVTMTGALGADGLVGKVSIEGMGEADWTGKRSK